MADDTDQVSGGNPPPESYAVRYFWHDKAWSALVRDFSVLPHALLFHGIEGLGKSALAWQLAKSLLCESPVDDAMACGICPSCRRYTAGTHPDLKSVTPLGDSRVIGVDQIREVGQFSTLTPHTAKRKVILLDPAEAMNTSAANAFLKVLEEPPMRRVCRLPFGAVASRSLFSRREGRRLSRGFNPSAWIAKQRSQD